MALTLGDVLEKKRDAPGAPAVRPRTAVAPASPVPLPARARPGETAEARSAAVAIVEARWRQLIARVGLLATGALLLNIALQLWAQGQVTEHHEVVAMVFALYALAAAALAAAVLPSEFARRAAPFAPVLAIIALLVWSYVRLDISLASYGTDNAVFSHVAAEQLLDGHNPYSVNDAALIDRSVERFGLPSTFVTRTTDGKPLEKLMSWPAGSIAPLVPALALGLDDVRWVVVAFEVATCVLLCWRAPSALRPVVLLPLVVDPDLFLQFTGGGVMDWFWVLPMTGCAIALYGGHLGRAAVLYGLAAGTKQQPWLLAPFLAVYVWHALAERGREERREAMLSFAGLVAAGFLLPNIAFMAWDFSGWLEAVLLPFREQLVPFGSGLSLLTQSGISNQPKSFYSLATFGVWGVLVLAYALHFRTLRHALWLAPAVVMWFGYRGLQNYYVYWTPMLLVALMVWWEEQQAATERAIDAVDRGHGSDAVLAGEGVPA